MGTLVVYAENRPKDDVFEVGNLGAFVNMHVYRDVPGVEDTVKVGTPIPQGEQSKLPVVDGVEAKNKLVHKHLNKGLVPGVDVATESPLAALTPPEDTVSLPKQEGDK